MFRALRQCFIPIRVRNTLLGQHWKKMRGAATVTVIRTGAGSNGKDSMIEFSRFTSQFTYKEEAGLKMQFIETDSFSDAMGIEEAIEPLPSSATDLLLDKFGPDQILVFNPDNYLEQSKMVSSFLGRLKDVAANNAQIAVLNEEAYINRMVLELVKAVKWDDGRELRVAPCYLKLSVGQKVFAARADNKGRRGDSIVWVMQEHKHAGGTQYRKGDVQLISCMIAAHQRNADQTEVVYPERMMGVKIRGDKFHFYSLKTTNSYLDDLERGAPNEDIEVFKYPNGAGFSLSVPEDRKQILSHMWSMRCYAVGLKKFNAASREDRNSLFKNGSRALKG